MSGDKGRQSVPGPALRPLYAQPILTSAPLSSTLMTKGAHSMTPIQYAAALLYCQEQIDLCGKDGEAEDARRFATLQHDLWAEVTKLGLAGRVEDTIEDIADAPDLVRDLARSLVHLCSGALSTSVDAKTSIETSPRKCA